MDERRTPTDPAMRVYGWRWGPDESRRPGLPWIGIFLVIFGGILLVDQMLPDYRRIGSATLLAAGLASLLVWVLRRGTIEGLQGSDLGPGWGTLFFGLAFLFIAAVRAWRNGGVGWQAFYGTILVLIGGSQIAKPDLAAVAWPVLLVVVGAVLLVRGTQRR